MSIETKYHNLIASYQACARCGDGAGVASHYTEDAIFLLPGQTRIDGRQGIQDYYGESDGSETDVTIKIRNIQHVGEIVYGIGTFEYDGDSGEWLQVLRLQEDDSLLIHRLCWNANSE